MYIFQHQDIVPLLLASISWLPIHTPSMMNYIQYLAAHFPTPFLVIVFIKSW